VAATNAANEGVRTDVLQREFQNKDYQRNLNNSVYADLLANMQNFTVTPPEGITMGQLSGGLNVDALPHRQEIGNTARQQAMYNLTHPQQLPSIPGPTDLTARGKSRRDSRSAGGS
jgi:hypothetical protein